ncbi:MAG: hypothetical protein O3A00_02290 [Planctomycetota bacterium]|nr:hypothetical protein [Planctomycetota bacterium]
MLDRRQFLNVLGTGAASVGVGLNPLQAADATKKKTRLAIVTTEWRFHSHAWHMGERFLVGYPIQGRWHQPPIDVVSVYVDQTPKNDLSRQRSKEFGFPIYPTIGEALRCGGNKLAVDAVLVIGEHGDYPRNDIGQKKYPRYEFFKDVVDVFKKDGRSVPVFNDKHLSWKWDWAKEMADTSREMGFPFLAGSSLPVTWRMPSIDMPYGADVEEVMCMSIGSVDSYDFHALETIQCMAERRKGGETGVVWVEAMRGDAVWKAMDQGSWQKGGWDPALFESCLCRSQTLIQPPTFSHRYPTAKQMRSWVKDPIVYRFQYADGLRGTMLMMNGLLNDFTFAAKLKGQSEPLSTLFYLPPTPNVVYSAALMSKAEQMFLTGKAPYPIERTLLTSGLVEAGVRSLAHKKRVATPYMNVKYQAPRQSLFWQS